MNRLRFALALAAAAALCLASSPAFARSDTTDLPVEAAKGYDSNSQLLDIPFYMKGQKHRGVAKDMGVHRTNKRTNAFNKSDEEACSIAFLSAIIQLQKRAQQLGGDAVVDIISITKNENLESSSNFRCAAGNIVANVALTGRVVKFK